jgi:hypothetical protein
MLQTLTTIPKDSCRFATAGGKSVQQGCNKLRAILSALRDVVGGDELCIGRKQHSS